MVTCIFKHVMSAHTKGMSNLFPVVTTITVISKKANNMSIWDTEKNRSSPIIELILVHNKTNIPLKVKLI